MKFVPAAIGRKLGEQGLLASEHAPKILFVGGVVGMVGSTVLACRATLKMEEVLDEIEHNKRLAAQAKEDVEMGSAPPGTTYSKEEQKRDQFIILRKGGVKIAKLYAPAVAIGGLSIFALTKSHNLLQDRNLALAAAYTAVDGAFNRYRGRVIDRFGEEVDQELRYESEQIDIVDEETGKVDSRVVAIGAPGSPYARHFDELSSRDFSQSPDINMAFLKCVQNNMNDRLRLKGHVFLNEVYDELGLSRTPAGCVVGWRWQGDGDNVIDFGIWDSNNERVLDFFNGRESAILLDFNVDGLISNTLNGGLANEFS